MKGWITSRVNLESQQFRKSNVPDDVEDFPELVDDFERKNGRWV